MTSWHRPAYRRCSPGMRMDGDGNGIPCERQWCNP
ncbi:MAG: excalibur calcium-binding domain-containing protein [Rubrivivax sp.]|nr:excalibur calcium-binding domain-containing protein [Rubrivivax sp.]